MELLDGTSLSTPCSPKHISSGSWFLKSDLSLASPVKCESRAVIDFWNASIGIHRQLCELYEPQWWDAKIAQEWVRKFKVHDDSHSVLNKAITKIKTTFDMDGTRTEKDSQNIKHGLIINTNLLRDRWIPWALRKTEWIKTQSMLNSNETWVWLKAPKTKENRCQ